MRDQFDRVKDQVEAKGASRPWVLVAIAVVAGVVLGAVLFGGC